MSAWTYRRLMARPPKRLFHLVFESHSGRALVPSPKRSASPRATSTLQWRIGLKALDPERPIREADIAQHDRDVRFVPQADIPGALTATHEDHCAATTSIWLVRCGRQHGTIHATSSFIALTIRTASGSVRPRTLISCTGKALISTPAVVATISDTTS